MSHKELPLVGLKTAPPTYKRKLAKKEIYKEDPMHIWFELTYASYLVLPRVALVSMPHEWQKKMVKLLEEMKEAFYPNDLMPTESCSYRVLIVNEKGQFVKDPLRHYRHHPKIQIQKGKI